MSDYDHEGSDPMSGETERESLVLYAMTHALYASSGGDLNATLDEMAQVLEAALKALAAHPAEPPRTVTGDGELLAAVRALVIAARTSGGTAGRDDGLCAALDRVEALLVTEPVTGDGVGELPEPLGYMSPHDIEHLASRIQQYRGRNYNMKATVFLDRGPFDGSATEAVFTEAHLRAAVDQALKGRDAEPKQVPELCCQEPAICDRACCERGRFLERLDAGRRVAAEPRVAALTDAARDVFAERSRQVEVKGWTPEHDDEHGDQSLSVAAACYALAGIPGKRPGALSPYFLASSVGWGNGWFKPSNWRRNLIKAGALILAEIERLDRAAFKAASQGGER